MKNRMYNKKRTNVRIFEEGVWKKVESIIVLI